MEDGSQEVLRFGLDKVVPLEPQNPYPILRVILAEKVSIFSDSSWNMGLFFNFFIHANTKIFFFLWDLDSWEFFTQTP